VSRTRTFIAVLVLAAGGPARAELALKSEPSSVHLQFRGPVAVQGVTPMSLQQLPAGEYLLQASGLGLVTARGRLRSTTAQGVNMVRWSSPYAFLAPPGFVHLTRHEGWRGTMFMTMAAGGVIGAIAKNAHHETASTDLELAQDAYDQATTVEGINAARLDLESAADREEDESHMRAIWTGYTVAVWAGTAVEAWLLTSSPSFQSNADGSFTFGVRTARPLDAALRSALVPGAGQRHMGSRWRALAFGTSVMAFAAGGIAAYDEYLSADRKQADVQRRYDAATTEQEFATLGPQLAQAADDTDEWKVKVWTLFGVTGAAYIWNVLDAMSMGASGWTRSAVDVSVVPRADGMVASLTWRLP